jgi:magnesium chelatase subunit I
MNPEEGQLRSQIMDRFGLRIVMKGLIDKQLKHEAYLRVRKYLANPRQLMLEYNMETMMAQAEIQVARDTLDKVVIPDNITSQVLELIESLKIDSLRAEVSLFEALRAFAALDGRITVKYDDVQAVAPMALRMRRSAFMDKYLSDQFREEEEINNSVNSLFSKIH